MYVINSWLARHEDDNMGWSLIDIVNIIVMACMPNCDDPICDYVILVHCLALVIASLGGLITEGWHTWIMEINGDGDPQRNNGLYQVISVLMSFLLCSTFTCDNVFVYMR